MDRLKVLSLNVRGQGTARRVGLVMPVLKQWYVVFVQDTYVNTQQKMETVMKRWDGEGFWGFGGEKCAMGS